MKFLRRHRLDCLWLIFLAAYIFAGTSLVPFHGDELTIMVMSRDYVYQFVQHDLDLVRFRTDVYDPGEQYLRLINGSVNKYLYGLAWHLAGFTLDDVNTMWDWAADWDYNVQAKHMPPTGMLQAARTASALLLVGSAVAMFALAYQVGGRWIAYLASAYYVLNPTILLNGRRAMFESGMLFGEVLVVLMGILWLRRPRWWTALLMGAAAGLAVSGKHTNMFVVIAVLGACAAYPFVARLFKQPVPPEQMRFSALMVIFAAVITALVFYALNPVWWGSNPLEHIRLVLILRGDLLELQLSGFGGYVDKADQFAGFGREVFINLPMYFEDHHWATWLMDDIAQYEASPWKGMSIGGSLPGAVIFAALIAVGIIALVRRPGIDLSARWLIALWALAVTPPTLLLTPMEWQRYYMPVYPVFGLLAALGVAWLVERIQKRSFM